MLMVAAPISNSPWEIAIKTSVQVCANMSSTTKNRERQTSVELSSIEWVGAEAEDNKALLLCNIRHVFRMFGRMCTTTTL